VTAYALGAAGPTQLACTDEAAVLAGESHRAAAVELDEVHDLLVHLAHQDHLHHVHGGSVGHAHPLHEAGFDAHPVEHLVDLRPSPMDDHGVQADVLHQDHVPGEALLERLVHHGVAAVLDDHDLAVELPDVRQRLVEHVGLLDEFLHRSLPLKK
jgi:hypothetical protein